MLLGSIRNSCRRAAVSEAGRYWLLTKGGSSDHLGSMRSSSQASSFSNGFRSCYWSACTHSLNIRPYLPDAKLNPCQPIDRSASNCDDSHSVNPRTVLETTHLGASVFSSVSCVQEYCERHCRPSANAENFSRIPRNRPTSPLGDVRHARPGFTTQDCSVDA